MADEKIGERASEILEDMLTVQTQIRLYHWGTKVYSKHIASGELYSKIDSFLDKFVETYMGKFNGGLLKGLPFKYTEMNLKLLNFNDVDIVSSLNEFKSFLGGVCKWLSIISSNSNSDLKNMIDELMGEVNKTLYLFTLS
jgi:hypothetical protein